MFALRLRSTARSVGAKLARVCVVSRIGTTPARAVTSEAEAHMPVMTGIARWELELPASGIEALAKRFTFASAQDAERFVKQVGDFAHRAGQERVHATPQDDDSVLVQVVGTDVEHDSDTLIPEAPKQGSSLGIRDVALASMVDDLGTALQCKVAWS